MEEVNNSLEKIMAQAFGNVWKETEKKHASLRMGAYMFALEKLVNALKIRGMFP